MAIAGIDTLYDYTKFASSVGGTANTDTVIALSGKAATDGFRYYIVDDDETTPLLTAQTAVRQSHVLMTSAQILLLATTQIEMIPAQGANTVIQFLGALLRLNYGTNVFTESSDNLVFNYTDDSGAAVSAVVEATGFIDQTATTFTQAIPVINPIAASAGCVNQAVVLDNTSGNFAGNAGDDNTIDVWSMYRVWYVG